MSFPGVIYGDYGDEKRTSSVRFAGGAPPGLLMILPDGRRFRQAIAGTAMTAGYLYQSTKVTDLDIENAGTITAATVGVISVVVTAAGTAIATDEYADGYFFISSTADASKVYKVVSNNSCAAASTTTVNLEKSDGLTAALAGTTLAGLRSNPYRNLTLMVAGTAYLGPIIGVPVVDIPANSYGWVQTVGPTPMATGATVLVANSAVMASTGGTDGTIVKYLAGSLIAGTQYVGRPIGYPLTVPTATGFSLVSLRLE